MIGLSRSLVRLANLFSYAGLPVVAPHYERPATGYQGGRVRSHGHRHRARPGVGPDMPPEARFAGGYMGRGERTRFLGHVRETKGADFAENMLAKHLLRQAKVKSDYAGKRHQVRSRLKVKVNAARSLARETGLKSNVNAAG